MMHRDFIKLTVLGVALFLLGLANLDLPSSSLAAQATATLTPSAKPSTAWEVFATGLDNPRGLEFGSDGFLYVAEGGQGGTKRTTTKDCEQVPAPSGPYSGGMTARISKISPTGRRTTIISGLPSSQTAPESGSDVSGVADVAFLDGTLYAVTAGAGCSHGLKDTVNALLRISADGNATQVADLSSFFLANPVQTPDLADFEPDGDVYSMVVVDGKFYVVEANHGELDEVTLDGHLTRIVDISAKKGHTVPTSVAYVDGNFYVGTLSVFPVEIGSARLYRITPAGDLTVLAPQFTAVLGVAFDKQGQLYALETTTADQAYPTRGSGAVVRIQPDSTQVEVVASGLTFPTAMAFGPDGLLYISNFGYGYRPGQGQIVRIAVPSAQN